MQEQLFRLAHEGMSINAYFEHGQGWRLILRFRRGDESWQDTARQDFSHLSTAELADVVCAVLHEEFGLI